MGPKSKTQVPQDIYIDNYGIKRKNKGNFIINEYGQIKIFKCTNCEYVFADLKRFDKHHRSTHGHNIEKIFEDYETPSHLEVVEKEIKMYKEQLETVEINILNLKDYLAME